MSEADAGTKEESPSKEEEEPVAAMKIKEERRSSSVDIVGGDVIVLHSIFYNGKTLRLPGTQAHIYNVVFRILKCVCNLVKQLKVAFPKGWDEAKPATTEIVSFTKLYNRVAKPFATNWSGSYNTDTLKEWGEPNCSQKVATEITTFAYECAVPRPADLNHYYKSFTSETYGETNLEQMASIIDELKIGSHDVFVDLGSGIGQLVCFTAAYAKCKKSVGIELSQTPANYANDLGEYFKKLMNHFGKNHGKFEHVQGDFLDPKFKQLICEEATIIFINNFAFSPDLMFRITTELLQDLKHGTRIVTTKPFGAHKKDITYRSTSDINAISHTVELKSLESGVSWTAKQVTFWLTTMDHTKLIKYYEEERKKKLDAKNSREGSEVNEKEQAVKKRKKERESSGHRDKIKTEQAAASHQSPKWNEPDTDYTPPIKKPKKEKNRDVGESSSATHSGKDLSKKKKIQSVSKTPKPPKSSHTSSRYSSETPTSHRSSATSSTSHPVPSQPKATAPPPAPPVPQQPQQQKHHHQQQQQQQEPIKQMKVEETTETEIIHGGQLDAKTMSALHTIREAATTSAQAAAIQDAINSVLSQPESSSSRSSSIVHPVTFGSSQTLPAPVAVYPPAPVAAVPAPAPAPPPPPPNVIPPCSELAVEQRHTFMIPPTDPLYNMIVSYYFEIKKSFNMSKTADPEIVGQLRQDIENEKTRRNELNDSITSTNSQIDELLASGVHTLKSRLDELGMPSVTDVTELLAGSKQIVTQHKGLTTNVAQMENSVAIEEQKLRLIGGPDALRYFDEALNQPSVDIIKLSDLVITTRPSNFVAQILPEDSPNGDSKVSPSSRRPRQQRPRQTTAGSGKRGNSAGRKSDGPTEDVELEIRQFVQHALKVDNAVKEKERKERLHRPSRPMVSTVRPPASTKQ